MFYRDHLHFISCFSSREPCHRFASFEFSWLFAAVPSWRKFARHLGKFASFYEVAKWPLSLQVTIWEKVMYLNCGLERPEFFRSQAFAVASMGLITVMIRSTLWQMFPCVVWISRHFTTREKFRHKENNLIYKRNRLWSRRKPHVVTSRQPRHQGSLFGSGPLSPRLHRGESGR